MINLWILLVKPVKVELRILCSDRNGAVAHQPPRKARQKHYHCGIIRRARAQGSNCTDTLYVKLYTTAVTPACIILIVHVRQGHLLDC
jgi:hypothetical protein